MIGVHYRMTWFKSVKKEVDYLSYCYNRSNDIVAYVFEDWKSYHGIIYGLNLVKDLAEFVVTDDMHGALNILEIKDLK